MEKYTIIALDVMVGSFYENSRLLSMSEKEKAKSVPPAGPLAIRP